MTVRILKSKTALRLNRGEGLFIFWAFLLAGIPVSCIRHGKVRPFHGRLQELGHRVEGDELDLVCRRFVVTADVKQEELESDLHELTTRK